MILRYLSYLVFIFNSDFCLAIGDDESVPPKPEEPKVAEASREAQDALGSFKLPEGWRTELFAAEPNVANIVAFTLDQQGRAYVCESYRQNKGITDNRGHNQTWLRADLASKTVEDRIAYHKLLLGDNGVAEYQAQDDRIRLVEDTDGDGAVDRSTVFASGFNRLEEGTGAGVLDVNGSVYYTCIPKLWKFSDRDGDGQADQRIVLQDGFGVRVAFRGHDMHGLIVGPDGRLYFSIGDRGYHVLTKEGMTLSDPASGAVFRCELDGSNLEVFASGLRNPQELAFDQFGNLFTGDNNSDGGDKARWVYVVEGGDTGWRMEYQYIPDRGPFNREKIWYPFHPEQPAYIVPPVENVADGPSGLIYYPGTGLGDQFRDCFMLADFRGTPNQSGIRTIRVEPQGAHFKLASNDKLIWNILATDLALGTDGALYISDWVDGWDGTGKGRIYRFASDADSKTVATEETKQLLRGDWSKLNDQNLLQLLGHLDQRVRTAAQFELVKRSQLAAMAQVAADSKETNLARVHAIWGLGQLARQQSKLRNQALELVHPLLADQDGQVRCAACLVLGDNLYEPASPKLVRMILDHSPRVAHYAATACSKLGAAAFDSAVMLLQRADNHDPVLRHAAVLAMFKSPVTDDQIGQLCNHSSMAVRLGAVVALRRRGSSAVEAFLKDKNKQIVAEAARAIHDQPINASFEELSKLISIDSIDDETRFRALNANYRLGASEHAMRIAQLANNSAVAERLRIEAVKMLVAWEKPDERDRYLNAWRPMEPRDASVAKNAVRNVVGSLLEESEEIQIETLKAVVAFNLTEFLDQVVGLTSEKSAARIRAEALRTVAKVDKKRASQIVDPLLNDANWQVSGAALEVLANVDPGRASMALPKALNSPDLEARQAAWRLAKRLGDQPAASELIRRGLDDYLSGKLPLDESLEVLEAIESMSDSSITSKLEQQSSKWQELDPVQQWRWALAGGDVTKGRNVFLYKSEVSCLRCHKVGNQGGEVGPALTDLGAKRKQTICWKQSYYLTPKSRKDSSLFRSWTTLVPCILVCLNANRSVC